MKRKIISIETEALHQKALNMAKKFQQSEADMISLFQEIESKKIYLELGFSSLFTYGVEALKLSDAHVYNFISVARKSREVPQLKEAIQSGDLSVSKARKIVSVITPENQNEWLHKAISLPRVQLEKEVAALNPEEVRENIRAISKDRFSMKLGISEELLQQLKKSQRIFPGTVRLAPKSTTRRIPNSIKHQIIMRDKGLCQYQSATGNKCQSSHWVHIHHMRPYAMGGKHEESNLITLCRSHHEYIHRK